MIGVTGFNQIKFILKNRFCFRHLVRNMNHDFGRVLNLASNSKSITILGTVCCTYMFYVVFVTFTTSKLCKIKWVTPWSTIKYWTIEATYSVTSWYGRRQLSKLSIFLFLTAFIYIQSPKRRIQGLKITYSKCSYN